MVISTSPRTLESETEASNEPENRNGQAWKGFTFIKHFEHDPVGSCEEAASARGISLNQELKTLIMKTPSGYVGVHLRADCRLDSKAIKRALRVKRIRFATSDELETFGLELGRVNPGNTAFCESHLVSQCVFQEAFLATNDGSFTRGVAFRPRDLLSLNPVKIGVFSHDA